MFLRNGEYVPDYTESLFNYYHRENIRFPVGVRMPVTLYRIIGSKCVLFLRKRIWKDWIISGTCKNAG
jgi:hypothetical protein